MTTPNYLDSNGFYFAGALNIKPGQNMPIAELTPQQAKIILKSDLVNKIPKEDLDEIVALANQSASYNSLPQPIREGQIITSRVVNGKLEITWADLIEVPLESSPFIGIPVVPLPVDQSLWQKTDWKTVNATISEDTITYTGGTYLVNFTGVPSSERILVLDHAFEKGAEFAIQIPLESFSYVGLHVDCFPDALSEPFQASSFSDISASIIVENESGCTITSYDARSYLEKRPYSKNSVNLYVKRLEDNSFTVGVIDNTGKVLKQFNSYGLDGEATLRIIAKVKEDTEIAIIKKGLIALVSDYKQQITEPLEEIPAPPIPPKPPLPSVSSAKPIAYSTSNLVNMTYENNVLTSSGGYLYGIYYDQGGQALSQNKPTKILVKLGSNSTYLYWGNGVSYADYRLSDTEHVKVEFGILGDGTKYVEIATKQGGQQLSSRDNLNWGQLSWKEGDLIEITIENYKLKYKNLTTEEKAPDSSELTFIDHSSTTFMTIIQGAASIEIGDIS